MLQKKFGGAEWTVGLQTDGCVITGKRPGNAAATANKALRLICSSSSKTSKASSLMRSTFPDFKCRGLLQILYLVPVFALCFKWLPGVSAGQNGSGAQQFFIEISARHRERRVLGQQHAPYGQQGLQQQEVNEVVLAYISVVLKRLRASEYQKTFLLSAEHP